MATPITSIPELDVLPAPVMMDGLPILYEDEEEEENDLGESNPHVVTNEILHVCLKGHLGGRPEYRVFSNMNLYYIAVELERGRGLPYVSPDIMVVKPARVLPEDVVSYQIGREGPAPVLTAEILSERSAQQRDLREKAAVYARLGVAEYILVDVSGKFLPQRLLLKRLQADGTWKDEQDPDGGVTSRLGFRLIIDTDGGLRMLDVATGKPYIRPDEAEPRVRELEAARQAEAAARREVEERVRALEAELARLRGSGGDAGNSP
ncbi:MAG TPA: Uma2 family endonuclease [Gemmataceae bacterium]|jgi:Uma2 family endonuclease|nr:Uma2 family endonuclease [Gemmataceae bacterium]